MKDFFTVFKFSMLIVGTIIGAGLASGQEIVVFFAQYGFVSLFFLIPIFFLFYLGLKEFLSFGKLNYSVEFKQKNNIFKTFDFISFLIFIVIGSAMLAGVNELLNLKVYNFSFPLWSLILIIISTLVTYFGIKGLINFSLYLVPLIIVGIIYVCIKGTTISSLSSPAFSTDFPSLILLGFSAVSYCCCNLVMANRVLFEIGGGLEKKHIKLISIITATIITILIGIIIVSILINDKMVLFADLPLVYMAFLINSPVGILFSVILFLSIITTLFATQYSFVQILKEKLKKGKKFVPSLSSLVIIFCFSLIGFGEIIKYVYPIIGGFGLIMLFFMHNLSFKSGFNSTNNKIHSSR